jgi:hypothetical protein
VNGGQLFGTRTSWHTRDEQVDRAKHDSKLIAPPTAYSPHGHVGPNASPAEDYRLIRSPNDAGDGGGGGVRSVVWGGRLAAVCAVALVLLTATNGYAAPSYAQRGPSLPLGTDALRDRVAPSSSSAVPNAVATIATVDTAAYSGFENSIYASSAQHVFVAYKRFIRNPAGTGGAIMRARLCVARSVDAGATWTVSIVDPTAGDRGDTIDDSVAIGGWGKTVYVAYLAQTGDAYEDMTLKIAKSVDGGKTWTNRKIATGGVGEFTSIDVVSADRVLVATNWEKWPSSALRLYSSLDGAATWTRSKVSSFGWYTGVDSAADGTTWLTDYHPGDTDLFTDMGPGPAGPWIQTLVAGSASDELYSGLGASIAVWRPWVVFLAYEEADRASVLFTRDAGRTWTRSDLGPGGWDTGTEVRRDMTTGRLAVFVSFWFVRLEPSYKGRVRLGSSFDGGVTWSVTVIPEPRSVAPYLDIAAPQADVRFVSYQTESPTTSATALKVARVTG